MQIQLNTRNLVDYRRFLAIRQLPTYRFFGDTAEFPDEYAARIGVAAATPAIAIYSPSNFLMDYQAAITEIALRKRKFAIFADCGLGKTLMYLEWIRAVRRIIRTDQKILIVSPLMVIGQSHYGRWGTEIVFSPFAGIGSELYTAIKNGRRAYGCELKDEYVEVARSNCALAEMQRSESEATLFDQVAV